MAGLGFNGMEDDEDEQLRLLAMGEPDPMMEAEPPMPAAAPAGGMTMPNTPRDPSSQREKLKAFLQSKMAGDQQMQSPQGRMDARAGDDALAESNRGLAFGDLLMRSAGQVGTLGGKSANTDAGSDFSKNLMALNGQQSQRMGAQRQEMRGLDDQQLKIRQYLAEKEQGAEDKVLDRDMQRQKFEAAERSRRETAGFRAKALAGKTQKPGYDLMPGEVSADVDFGKKWSEWNATGKAQYENNKSLLTSALEKVPGLKDQWLSPRVDSILPDNIRPEATRIIQQEVSKAAIGAARAALGSQFTEKESFWVQRLSYDPALSPEANMTKIKTNLAEAEAMAASMESNGARWNEYGTISQRGGRSQPAAPAAPVAEQVKILGPDGETRMVPKESVQKYLAKGGKVVQ